MAELVSASYLVLWVLVIALALVVVALARQVGVLHERVAPAGALMPTSGPKVGELTEAMPLTAIDGVSFDVGGADRDGLATFILFISPTCPVCKSLVPAARSLVMREGRRMRLIFASDGDDLSRHQAYVKDLGIESYPYVVSQPLGLAYSVSKLPFAVLIGADGTLQSKGLVNSREHLESLVEAMDTGIATLQEYVQQAGSASEEKVS